MRLLHPLTLFTLLTLTLQAQITPLTRAIRLEKFDEAKKYITPELVNKIDQGKYHPLTYAAYTANNDLIEALLKAGANPNTIEHNGKTALSVVTCLNLPENHQDDYQTGATYPNCANVCPPVATTIRPDAVESLKILLELYPAPDMNAGWPWPKDIWDSLPYNGADEIKSQLY